VKSAWAVRVLEKHRRLLSLIASLNRRADISVLNKKKKQLARKGNLEDLG
jgi:hypothetical protein